LAITSFEKSAMAAVCSWSVRWDVHYVEHTGSTNRDLLAMARAGAPPGTVLRAGVQTAGRGRLGRSWQAPAGTSLLASILLEAGPSPFVAVARVALAAADASRELAGVDAALKWPNDLMVGDRKLAGLLAESDSASPVVVVGIGCNVAWPAVPEDLRDVLAALADSTATVPSPARLLDVLLEALERRLADGADAVMAAYRERCATLGLAVRVDLGNRILDGVAADVTPSGELVVAVGGRTELVRAGDVVHVRAR
jgi:BirA family biotin operon repressor/biotin-[acetyl-CoA-carboxylase] ligase